MRRLALLGLLLLAACDAYDTTTLDLPITRPRPGPAQIEVAPLTSQPVLPPTPTPSPHAQEWPYPVLWGEEIASRKLILVLDGSQSMFDTPGRIQAARAELCRMIQGLPPHSIFDVVRFTHDQAVVLWPHNPGAPDEGMRPATDENKAAAIQFVCSQTAGGNTPTWAGVHAALTFRLNPHVVLVTDGAPFGSCPWAGLELDPFTYGRGWVPGVPGPGPESVNPRAEGGTSLAGATIEHEYMIRWSNRVWRPSVGARPARIDVFGIDCQAGGTERDNARWFCATVAARSGGAFVPVPIP